VEFLGLDRRYESSIDSLGRIPADEQLQINVNLTYTIVGIGTSPYAYLKFDEPMCIGKRIAREIKAGN